MKSWLLLGAGLLVAPAAAQSFLTVGTGGMFATLGAAVAAASDGDAIEVRGVHNVSGLTIAKSLRIFGTGALLIGGPMNVSVPAGKEVELATMGLGWYGGIATNLLLDLTISNSQGRVTLLGTTGGSLLRITNSQQVIMSNCQHYGFPALAVLNSTVILERCRFDGQVGSENYNQQSTVAATFVASDVGCVDTLFQGGNGHLWSPGQYPGSGAVVAFDSTLRLAGLGSNALSGTHTTTAAIWMSAGSLRLEPHIVPTVQLMNGATSSTLAIPNIGVVLTNESIDLRLRSPIGTLGAIVVGYSANRTNLPGIGVTWLDPQSSCVAVIGVQTGNLGWSATLPTAVGLFTPHYRWQGAVLGSGTVSLSDPGALLVRWWP